MPPATTIRSACLILILGTAAVPAAGPQTLRVLVDEVIVPFSVRDDGRPVHGLTREDFTVLEDGRAQTITEFTHDPVPLSAALLIDTGLEPESLDAVRAAIPTMVAAFSDFDEVSVYRFDDVVVQTLDFEDEIPILDHERLRDALDAIAELEPTVRFTEAAGNRAPPPGPVINGVPTVPGARPARDRGRRVLHDAIYTAARNLSLRAEGRRRVIIVLTDGIAEGHRTDVEEVHRALLEADVQVYPIGVNVEFLVRITDSLDDYADLTGGVLFYRGSDSLQGAFAEVTGLARNQYLITYNSNNEPRPGEIPFREIEIVGRGDYEIDHRFGYYQIR